jgi:sulfur carrier protein ThiS
MTASRATDQITIRITLFADMRRFLPPGVDGPQSYALPAGATVADALAAIGIPAEDEVTAGINGDQAQRDTLLNDGDELVLFSPMEGG